MDILNLGCGDDRIGGAVGCDIDPTGAAVDVVCDLNRTPYPFCNDTFVEVICQDILEHLDNIPAAMRELHRVLKPRGVARIRVPHYTSMDAYGDPTHRRFLSARSFDFCLAGANAPPGLNSSGLFRLKKREIVFYRVYRALGISALANRFPHRWEGHFAYWFPAQYMLFELEAIKN